MIFALLVAMTVWEIKIPGGAPRQGILGFETTRGDRLFISLLGSAYIHIFWLALTSLALWWALARFMRLCALLYSVLGLDPR